MSRSSSSRSASRRSTRALGQLGPSRSVGRTVKSGCPRVRARADCRRLSSGLAIGKWSPPTTAIRTSGARLQPSKPSLSSGSPAVRKKRRRVLRDVMADRICPRARAKGAQGIGRAGTFLQHSRNQGGKATCSGHHVKARPRRRQSRDSQPIEYMEVGQ